MITYGYFNSINHDRVYDADQMSNYFEGLVSDGVFENVGQGLQVNSASGMNVTVGTGRAIINCKWIKNDSALTVPITGSTVNQDRYTAVVFYLDTVNREMGITTIDGTPGPQGNAQKPTITNTSTMIYKVLAWVLVPAGSTSIAGANITDTRGDNTVCGWVTGIVVNGHVERFYKRVTMNPSITSIPLNMPNYIYDPRDILFVHSNGLLCSENYNYIIDTSADPVEVHPPSSVTGTVVEITVLKSVLGE